MCGLALHDVNATYVTLHHMKEMWWVSNSDVDPRLVFFCVCVFLMIYLLFCQKFLVCSVCNENVIRDVTLFLTERVQMKLISTCTWYMPPSMVNQKVSGKMFLNFVMLATLITVHAVTCTNHQHSCDGQFNHHVKSHKQGFNTRFLKINVCEWSKAIMCFGMLFKIQKHFSPIEKVNEQEHHVQKLTSSLCYEKIKLLL
jgi:hypothetical protein